jgi:hypothetical protein
LNFGKHRKTEKQQKCKPINKIGNMNQITKDLLKQFVETILDDDCGINKEAYALLTQMLVNDKEVASVLHDTMEMSGENKNGRFVINPN